MEGQPGLEILFPWGALPSRHPFCSGSTLPSCRIPGLPSITPHKNVRCPGMTAVHRGIRAPGSFASTGESALQRMGRRKPLAFMHPLGREPRSRSWAAWAQGGGGMGGYFTSHREHSLATQHQPM